MLVKDDVDLWKNLCAHYGISEGYNYITERFVIGDTWDDLEDRNAIREQLIAEGAGLTDPC